MGSKYAIAFLVLGTFAIATGARAQPADLHKSTCFSSSQLKNWKAADAKTIYFRVGPNRYFRLDLAAPCRAISRPGAFLVTKLRGSGSICSAVDWDLHVAQSWRDVPQACIVMKMTELSPAEVAAIPPKAKP